MASKKHGEPEKEENLERWLLTYADLITLLMLYFIILYSMSNVNKHKYDELARALSIQFGGGKWIFSSTSPVDARGSFDKTFNPNKALPASRGRSRTEMYYSKAISMFIPEIQTKKMQVTFTERGVVITLGADFYFQPGAAELTREGRNVLERLSTLFEGVSNNIRIEGHADSDQIVEGGATARRYPSNWDLSSARAIYVLKRLEDGGVDRMRLAATAYGDTKPIDTSDNPSARAANRRIEIIIQRDE
ncbi:MAG: OmpA family protein [Spirochaetes bacterium]|nr:OmpA family protein [Spirochaetota bacterium]